MDQRSAALLTKSQREGLLRGLGSSSSDRKLRQRINTRVQDSTVDLRLLFSRMEDDELEEAFRSDLTSFEEHMHRLEEVRRRIHDFSRRTRGIPSNIFGLTERLKEYTETVDDIRSLEDELDDISEEGQVHTQKTRNQQQIEEEIRELEDECEFLREEILEIIHDSKDELMELDSAVVDITDHFQAIIDSSDELQIFLKNDYTRFIEGIRQAHDDHEELKRELELLLDDIEEVERAFKSEDYPRRGLPRTEIDFADRAEKVDELLEECLQKYSRRARRRDESEPKLREAMEILHSHLGGQAFSPDMRENVVKSIGFYLRVSDAVGADLEHMIEEAIESTITTHSQNEILDSVSVNIRTESKDRALEHGKEKMGKYRLSNAELRALAGSGDVDIGEVAGIDSYSLQDLLLKRLLEEPEVLGSDIEFTEIEPTIEYHGLPVRTDLMGNDSEGNTVLIDIEVDLSEDLTAKLERMQLLIDAVDGDDEVRGIVVVPRKEFGDEKSISEYEFPRVDICPISSE